MRFTCVRRRHFDDQTCIARAVDKCDLVSLVLDAPAVRCCQRKAQTRVIEVAAPRQALLGAFTEGHALQYLLITGAALVVIGNACFILRSQLGDAVKALVIAGVRRQPAVLLRRRPALCARQISGKALLVFEYVDHVHHVAWVKADARQILGAQAIGLKLLLAPVTRDIACRHSLRQVACHAASTANAL